MMDALRKLRNEVQALKAFEPEVRAIIGNTNWACLFARVAIADSILETENARRLQSNGHSDQKDSVTKACEECGGDRGGFHFFGCSNASD